MSRNSGDGFDHRGAPKKTMSGRARTATPVTVLCLLLCSCSGSSSSSSGAARIDSTSPGVIQGNDNNVAWTLNGAGFDTAATVTSPYSGVTIAGVTVVSAAQITFSLSAAGSLATGAATLTVTNPDSSTAATIVPAIPATVTLSNEVQPVFTQSCATAGCHAATGPSGLNLSSGIAHAATVSVVSTQVPSLSLIAPGDSASSYLMDKLDGTQTVGAKMPTNGALTATELMLVRKWIEAGALNN